MMRVPRRAQRAGERVAAAATSLEGFRFVRQTAPIRALLLLLGVVSLAGMPYAVLMPIFADQILHGGAQALGHADGRVGRGRARRRAGAGDARRASAASAAGWRSRRRRSARALIAVLALARVLALGAAAGAGRLRDDGRRWPSSNTLIQAMVPDALRGRVMAVYSMMFMGMAPFGALLAGALAERIGRAVTVARRRRRLHRRRRGLRAPPAPRPRSCPPSDRCPANGRRRSTAGDDRRQSGAGINARAASLPAA